MFFHGDLLKVITVDLELISIDPNESIKYTK